MAPEKTDFWNELHRMMLEGMKAGKESIEINAGDLHKRVDPIGADDLGEDYSGPLLSDRNQPQHSWIELHLL